MNEVRRIKDAVKPAEILFVVDSMTGQDAVNTANLFTINWISTELSLLN